MTPIRLYSESRCPYCTKLKQLLDDNNIHYTEIDVNSEPGAIDFTNIQKVTKSDMLPTVIVGNKALVPSVGFNTIDECFSIIQSLLI